MTPQTQRVGEADYFFVGAGSGPPVVLLHGFPQTHLCWRGIVGPLAEQHTVIAVDIRGYGASEAPPGGPRGEGYSKREMAAEVVELMRLLGHERFSVVGHDRGARVGFRLALDWPDHVEALAAINVIPTVDQFERMGREASLGYWPWYLLAQPAPFPERLLASGADWLLDHIFDTWSSDPAAIDRTARAAYREAFTESTIAAACGDFRASFHLDRAQDTADRSAGRTIRAPVLAVAGADESQLSDAGEVWSRWADDLRSLTVPGGHFVPEESPRELAAALQEFLDEA